MTLHMENYKGEFTQVKITFPVYESYPTADLIRDGTGPSPFVGRYIFSGEADSYLYTIDLPEGLECSIPTIGEGDIYNIPMTLTNTTSETLAATITVIPRRSIKMPGGELAVLDGEPMVFQNYVLADPAKVTATLTPSTTEVVKGTTQKFVLDAAGYESYTQIVWTVDSKRSTIDASGLLTVGADETAERLTVTATSGFYGLEAKAIVTVKENPPITDGGDKTDGALTVSGWPANGSIKVGETFTATPNINGGTWTWDESYFSATFNGSATFTALKAGKSIITYTAGDYKISREITIVEANSATSPKTGDPINLWFLMALAGVLTATGLVLRRRKAELIGMKIPSK